MWLKILPWAGCALLGWLLLQAHQTIGEKDQAIETAVVTCNSEKQEAARLAERSAREALAEAHANQLAELARQRDAEAVAREVAEKAFAEAQTGVATRDEIIRRLEVENFNAENLPDSRACLNVFAPGDVVERMFWAEDGEGCASTGDSEGAGADEVCGDSSGASGGATPDFAAITIGDSFVGWNHDRKSLRQCNGQLRAIKTISDTVIQ